MVASEILVVGCNQAPSYYTHKCKMTSSLAVIVDGNVSRPHSFLVELLKFLIIIEDNEIN